MEIEFEATFINIDKDAMRETLKKTGAALVHPEFLMKRIVFTTPTNIPGGWLRVRQEFDKITMSLKIVDGDKIENQKETQVIVNDFDKAVEFLENCGATRKAYQENKRELWKLDGTEVTIDTWPGLGPIIEIEGGDEKSVKHVAEQLGFDYAQAYFGSIDKIYQKELGITPDTINNHTPIITFDNPPKKTVHI